MTGSPSSQPPINPTYERKLPDGMVYRMVPPEVGVPVIRRWLEHDWPMTAQQALALRDELGWTPSPRKETLVTTNLGSGRPKDASITIIKNKVNSFRISLASYAPIDFDPETMPLTIKAFNEYMNSFASRYGTGNIEEDNESTAATWRFPNHASLRVGMIGSVLTCTINSPAANYAAAAEAELLEWEAAEEGTE